ncbi:MAG: hypothetical protein QM791_04110 [Ferruginibacter sp.]
MKNLFIALLLLFCSCKKESTTNTPQENNQPRIVDYVVSKIFEAGAMHPKFTVNIISDPSIVEQVQLLRGTGVCWYIDSPSSGQYIMYDHLSEWPTYEQFVYYHFEFHKKDGSKISTTPFQVY